MKKLVFLLLFAPLILGCPSATTTTPPAALAPGYTSQTDQQFGQALAAAHALAAQATQDYAKLTPKQQLAEKTALNAFVTAVNAADAVYQAYHVGQATAAQVQTALTQVNTAQANYTNVATGSAATFGGN